MIHPFIHQYNEIIFLTPVMASMDGKEEVSCFPSERRLSVTIREKARFLDKSWINGT
jgi:hypothetical protein